jgi:hypothetical protein
VELHIIATVLGSLTLGAMAGYAMGWAHGRARLAAFKEGMHVAHTQRCEIDRASGGPCWIKGRLPPGADE